LLKCIAAYASGLLSSHGRKAGPALLNVVAAAMRADGGSGVVLSHGQGFGEGLVAGFTDVFIVGHGNLHELGRGF
jgi:hypothetical protein